MRKQCSWRKVKFSGKKERKKERRLETDQPLKVICVIRRNSLLFTKTQLNSCAEKDKVKKRAKEKAG